MKKLITLLIVFILFIVQLNAQITQKERLEIERYKDNMNQLYQLFSNYCIYNRDSLYIKLYTYLSNLTTIEENGYVDRYPFVSDFTLIIANAIYGNNPRNKIDEVKRKITNLNTGNAQTRNLLLDYNLYFFNVRDNSNTHLLSFLNNIDSIFTDKYIYTQDRISKVTDIKNFASEWQTRGYTERDLDSTRKILDTLFKNYTTLCNGFLDVTERNRYHTLAQNTENHLSDLKNFSKDYELIVYILRFFNYIFDEKIPNAENRLNQTIENYNRILQMPSAKRYPLLNDYKFFFEDTLANAINALASSFRSYNQNYTFNINIDSINNPCTQQNNDEPIPDDDNPAHTNTPHVPQKPEDNNRTKTKDYAEIIDSTFFTSLVPKVYIIKLPNNTKFKDIIDIYMRYSKNKGEDSLYERQLILNNLITKNRFLYRKSERISSYKELKEWKLYSASITEDSIAHTQIAIYNKAALMLTDAKNPDNNKYLNFNDFFYPSSEKKWIIIKESKLKTIKK